MGIRETLTKKPVASICVATVFLVGAVTYTVRSVMSSDAYSKAYFTTDDGQSFFAAGMEQRAPFDHHGKPAYKAYVFSCDGGKTTFVGYLERITPEGLTRLDALQADYDSGKIHALPMPSPDETEVKKPGSADPWVRCSNYQKAQKITNVQCPNGGTPEIQLP